MIEVKYAEDKRPLKITAYYIDSEEDFHRYNSIRRFVENASNAPEHVAKMSEAKFFALVELLSTLACREFSPTTNWGVTKPAVRGIVLFVLYAGIKAGKWPTRYEMTETTFVQAAGDDDE